MMATFITFKKERKLFDEHKIYCRSRNVNSCKEIDKLMRERYIAGWRAFIFETKIRETRSP